jgi:hypothetical protein
VPHLSRFLRKVGETDGGLRVVRPEPDLLVGSQTLYPAEGICLGLVVLRNLESPTSRKERERWGTGLIGSFLLQ